MLSIKKTKKDIPEQTEFTDEEGQKWIQTSTDDLFSAKELDDILDKIEKDKNKDEIVLAQSAARNERSKPWGEIIAIPKISITMNGRCLKNRGI